MSYWPDGIIIDSVSSPVQILKNAKKEFEDKSSNVLSLNWSEEHGKISVFAKTKNHKSLLFCFDQQNKGFYPVTYKDFICTPIELVETLKSLFNSNEVKCELINLIIRENKCS